MTIQSPTARVSFPCNSVSTVFPVNIQAYLATDFLVLLTNAVGSTTLTLNSDYTLVASGSLTPTFWSLTTQTGQLVSPYVTGNTLQVILNPSETQLTQYTQGQAFPSLAVQTNLDRLTQMVIREGDQLSRAIVASDSDVNPVMLLPAAALRASKNLGFDPSGNLAVNLALASGTISTATLAPFLNLQQTTAEAGITIVSFQYPPGNVLRYGANTIPGTTDMSAAFQAAVNQCAAAGGAPVFVPAGVYSVLTTITHSTPAQSIRIVGAGENMAIIVKTGDSDLFNFSNSNVNQVMFIVESLRIGCATAMVTGAAFNFTDAGVQPTVSMRDIFIINAGSFTFAYGIRTTNCIETRYQNVIIYGLGASSGLVGWALTNTGSNSSVVNEWVGCSVYNASVGVNLINAGSPGIEGDEFLNCNFTNCKTGLLASNSAAPGYYPPQISWIGGQLDCQFRNLDITSFDQVTVQGCLFYNRDATNTANSAVMNLVNVGDMNIQGNIIYGGTGPVINYQTVGSFGGIIANNLAYVNAAYNFLSLNAANLTKTTIANNVNNGGANTVLVAGTLDPTVVITGNTPDGVDVFDSLTTTATPSLLTKRALYFNMSTPGGATTVTKLTSRSGFDECWLLSTSNLITIQHNSNNPDGFNLQGGVNFVFGVGAGAGKLHLKKLNGGYWTEIGRD